MRSFIAVLRPLRNWGVCSTFLFLHAHVASETLEGSHWTQTKGKGYALCDGLLKELRRYRYPNPFQQPNLCAWAVVANFHGLTEPPWQETAVGAHEELLFQLQQLTALGAQAYAAQLAGANPPARSSSHADRSRANVKKFVEDGGSLQLWRMPLPTSYSVLHRNPATSGSLNFVHVRHPLPATAEGIAACPQVPKLTARGHVLLANDALTGPDPRQFSDAGAALQRLNGSSLWFFRGQLHRFEQYGQTISVTRDDIPPTDWSGDFCRLEFRYPNSGRK